MTDVTAVLITAGVGALAGVGGVAVGAVASLRSSQLAARAPLAPRIHALAQAIIKLGAATSDPQRFARRVIKFNIAWNDLAIHQKVLVPSYRVATLNDLVFKALPAAQTHPDEFIDLAGQTLSVVSDMIAAHSRHLLRWRALWAERRLLRQWLATKKSRVMSDDLRDIIDKLARGKKVSPYG